MEGSDSNVTEESDFKFKERCLTHNQSYMAMFPYRVSTQKAIRNKVPFYIADCCGAIVAYDAIPDDQNPKHKMNKDEEGVADFHPKGQLRRFMRYDYTQTTNPALSTFIERMKSEEKRLQELLGVNMPLEFRRGSRKGHIYGQLKLMNYRQDEKMKAMKLQLKSRIAGLKSENKKLREELQASTAKTGELQSANERLRLRLKDLEERALENPQATSERLLREPQEIQISAKEARSSSKARFTSGEEQLFKERFKAHDWKSSSWQSPAPTRTRKVSSHADFEI
jgi:hypothetical protein